MRSGILTWTEKKIIVFGVGTGWGREPGGCVWEVMI